MKLNKTKKLDRMKLIRKLDSVFSLYIRLRDNYTCFTCGKTRENAVIQCGHLFSRISHSTRWHELNAHAQCSGCNMRHEYDFEIYRRKFVEKYGYEKYETLYEIHNTKTKFSVSDLIALINFYQKKIHEGGI